jgi:nucleoside-diphosphate-sugar epimerase
MFLAPSFVLSIQRTMTLQGKTVLVTGATGFLGSALVSRLVTDGVRVRALARRPHKAEFLRDLKNVEIVPGDVNDLEVIETAVKGCAVVFHVAAALGGDIARQQKTNIQGTHTVMQAAHEAPVKRVVYVSTISVYGYKQSGDVTEDTPLSPGHDPYAITKAEAEAVVQTVAEKHHLATTIIRPGMIYGPGAKLWTRTMFKIARRNPTIFIGNGNGSAYPIYVDDVVDLMMVLATHPKAAGQAFNCTPDPSPTWREFLNGYARLAGHQNWLGIPPALVSPFVRLAAGSAGSFTQRKDLPDMLRFLQGTVTYKMDKARTLIGWQPKVDLTSGMQKCASWLREIGLLKT